MYKAVVSKIYVLDNKVLKDLTDSFKKERINYKLAISCEH